ncbi:MAG: hypothetical protein AB7P17_04110 [Nitrospirales bacterium]
MNEELDVFKLVTQRLTEADIPYMVTGSMALNFYAVPRMTRDIDLVVELQEEDADRLSNFFQDQFYVDRAMVREAVRHQTMFNLIHTAHVIKVDMVVRKDMPYRREEFSRRRVVSIDNHAFHIVAPEDLILSKLEWAKDSHSEVQLEDARNLLANTPDLDRDYLRRWAGRLGVETLYREVGG